MIALIIVYSIVIFFLLVLSSLFSASDMVYAVVPQSHLNERAKTSKRAAKALSFAQNYEETITTLLFGNSLVNILASSLGTLLAMNIFRVCGGSLEIISTIIEASLLVLILMFGEIFPKTIGRIYCRSLSTALVPFVTVFKTVFYPVSFVSVKIAGWMTKPILKKTALPDEGPSDEELQQMVEQIEKEGFIDEDQSELISRSIEFKDTVAYEIMTPRVRIEAVDCSTNLSHYYRGHEPFSHSRIIVFDGDKDNIIGYFPLKVLLKRMLDDQEVVMDDILRPIDSVPRTMQISAILAKMKKNKTHVVVVKDEYGGTEGILTLEDILEELVGELWDESEKITVFIKPLARKRHFLVRGDCDIEDFFDYFHLDEDNIDSDYNTFSGWINDKIGGFASVGNKFRYGKVDVLVTEADEYTVKNAEVTYHPRRKSVKED